MLSAIRLTDEEYVEMEKKRAMHLLRNNYIRCKGFMGDCVNHTTGKPDCVWPFCEERKL